MEKFDFIYNKMSTNYDNLCEVMRNVYFQLQEQPENEQLRYLLGSLGEVAEGMINQQIDFVDAYCSTDVKDNVIGKLENKKEVLFSALKKDLSSKTK